jgi:hypothetical protein
VIVELQCVAPESHRVLVVVGDQPLGVTGAGPRGQLLQQATEVRCAILQGDFALLYMMNLFWYWLLYSHPVFLSRAPQKFPL